MGSKQVLDDQKLSRSLIEAARTNAEEIGRRRSAHFVSLGMKSPPSAEALRAVVLAEARALEIRQDALDRSEEALDAELADDEGPLQARDAQAMQVRGLLVDFRDGVRSNCSDVAVRALGFLGETPRDPEALLKLGRMVIKSVHDAPPKSMRKGVRYDVKAAIEGLDEALDALSTANATVVREKREEQSVRAQRDEAWTAFDREHGLVYASLDAAMRGAGLSDLADRLRSSEHAAATAKAEEPAPKPAPIPSP